MFETQHGLVRAVKQVIHQTTIHVHHRIHQEKMEPVMFALVHRHGRREVVRRIQQPVQHVRQLIHIRCQNLIWYHVKQVIIRMATVVNSVLKEVTVTV